MTPPMPIILIGSNLDERHKYLNSLVNKSYNNCENFDITKGLPEKSPIDRIFKIELASKYQNVDYIFRNLQDDDMLFVSTALKATWMLEKQYEDKMNPKYLEDHLYPKMITTAVNKMKNWMYLNLNDEKRCKVFYDYYFEEDFNLALKFLLKCSKEDIENEFGKVIYKITPFYLKVLSEKTSKIVKIFFESIATDDKIKRQYLENAKAYFDVIRYHLKTEGDMVLDIAEKYFDKDIANHKFSRDQTRVIMKHHKAKFWKKPEFYTTWLLNIQAIADSLDSEEAKSLVIILARASYISNNFTYQNMEPLIKRLKPDERAAFKNKIFVKKDFGETVKTCPYEIPENPANDKEYETIFDDLQPEPSEYKRLIQVKVVKRPIKKKKGRKYEICDIYSVETKEKTLLDKLFEEFRFMSFSKTLYELRKRIAAESSPQNRQYMILVLVSKSGGRPDAIASLLELLEKHINETANFRAAIIRSLVKRAQVWRLPEKSWDQLIKYGHGLGLDGQIPEAECFEGLHAVVIRSLLLTGDCESNVKKSFVFKKFSTLSDYALESNEKSVIAVALPKLLYSLVYEYEFSDEIGCRTSTHCIDKLIESLETYKINLKTYPGFIDTIAKFATKELSPVDHILDRLYRDKIARKQLFRHMFPLVKTDESYLNALRHDTSVLEPKSFAEQYGVYILGVDRFFRKLAIYFSEVDGLASKFLQELKAKVHDKVNGRLIAFLINEQFVPYLDELDAFDDKNSKLLASVVRANAHLARPALDIDTYGWKKIGAKHVGCKLIKCRLFDIDITIEKLLQWKRTARTALVLANRTSYETDIFVKVASLRPTVAIKCGLKMMKSQGDKLDIKIWHTIKPIIEKLDVNKPDKKYIISKLEKIDEIPMKIRPEYTTVIYTTLLKISLFHAMPSLCHVEILLPDVEVSFIENIVSTFLTNDFCTEKLNDDYKQIMCNNLFIRILLKYVLLSKTEEEQKRRIEKYFNPILVVLDEIRSDSEKNDLVKKYFPEMLFTLKYSKVFLSTQYVSPLPVIENIVVWMRNRFAIEQYCSTFSKLHMLMLFYKAIEQALGLAPDVYSDSKRRRSEGVEIFGKIFGKFIASEVNYLRENYFETMPELYITCITRFLERFNFYDLSSDLLTSLIKGIFGENSMSAYRLGIYLLNEKYYDIREEHTKELIIFVKNIESSESQWLISILER